MIEIRELIKNYGEIRAVDRVTCSIARGEIAGLLGLNGAGKSTLMRIVSCLLTPTSGTVMVDGNDVVEKPESVRRLIGYLPEEPPLYKEMKVSDFLRFVAGLRGVSRADLGGRVQQAMERCKLTHVADARIETLSYGYRKRVGIAQAIVHAPPLVILDEPIAGLDPAQIVEMREMIRSLGGEHTILVSSHILSEISQVCDRLLVIHKGRLVANGTEEEISAQLERKFRLSIVVAGEREKLEKTLGGIEGVKVVELSGRDGQWVLECECDGDKRAQVARGLVGAGLDLLELSTRRDQLEEAFLKLTESKEARA